MANPRYSPPAASTVTGNSPSNFVSLRFQHSPQSSRPSSASSRISINNASTSISPVQSAGLTASAPATQQAQPTQLAQPISPSRPTLAWNPTSGQLQNLPKPPGKQGLVTILRRIFRLSWWWEAGGVALSVIFTCLIAAILISTDDKSLASWSLSIQPNSLIAVFSTLAKTALLVPVTECISQLKWNHFENPKRLSQLQVFDDASRGPWGALILLLKARMTSMASLGALITIIALAFEPFAQQVVEFPSRKTVLGNLTGSVASSNAWSETGLDSNNGMLTRATFDSAVLSEIMNRTSLKPDYFCPTSECQIPDFTSLATCVSCEYEDVKIGDGLGCQFSVQYFESDGESQSSEDHLDIQQYQGVYRRHINDSKETNVAVNCTREKPGYANFQLIIYATVENTNDSTQISRVIVQDLNKFGTTFKPQRPPVQYTTNGGINTTIYHGCRSQFDSPSELNTIDTYSCLVMPVVLNQLSDLETFNGFQGRMTWCRLHFCAQHYQGISIQNGIMNSKSMTSTPLNVTGFSSEDRVATATDDTSTQFYIGVDSLNALLQMLHNSTEQFEKDSIEPLIIKANSPVPFFESVVNVFTALIRSSSTNGQARNVTGDAYGPETYVRVRWGWFILPVSVVLLSTMFFLLTIFQSWNREHRFKSSILATLFHGLEGWDADQLQVGRQMGEKKERVSTLEDKAKLMKATLKENSAGSLKFIKTD